MEFKFEKIEQLNEFAVNVEAQIASIQEEAVKKEDVELVSKSNEELKVELEATQKVLADIKDNIRYEVESKTEDQKLYMIGDIMLSMKRGNAENVHKYGLRKNLSESAIEGDWNIQKLSAPDLGTPLRGDSTTGSYLVPTAVADQILRYNPSPSALMGAVTSVPMSVRSIQYPTLATNIGWTKVTNEATAKTESTPVFGFATLAADTYAFWVPFTEELREDSVINIGQLVAQIGTEQWRYTFDNSFLNTTTTGLLEVAGTNAVSMGAGRTSAADFVYSEAIKVPAALDTQGKRVGSAWLMHPTVEDVLRQWVDDGGRPYYVVATDLMPGRLLGYPIFLSDAMPDATSVSAGEAFIAFGPMSKLLHGNRVGLEVKYYTQTADNLIYDREFIRLRTRQGFVVGLPGNFVILKTAAA